MGIKRIFRTQAVKGELEYDSRTTVVVKKKKGQITVISRVMNPLSKVLWKSRMGLDVGDGEDIAFADLDQNGGDDRDEEAALIKLNRHQCSVLVLWVIVLIHKKNMYISDQHPCFVFSPLSLNAKLVGSLYECLAPAEGEVRGCISCAYLSVCVCVWFVHGYIQMCHFQHPTVI